jgi:hypothetical protein
MTTARQIELLSIEDHFLMSSVELEMFVRKYLIVEGTPCSQRHCGKPTSFFPLLEDKVGIVGAYLCPENYVSRIVYFSSSPDKPWFEDFLRIKLDGGERVRAKDIRQATRHGWELGREAEKEISVFWPGDITQVYWTFYPRNDEEKTNGNFLCSKCHKLFVKPNSRPGNVCNRHTTS